MLARHSPPPAPARAPRRRRVLSPLIALQAAFVVVGLLALALVPPEEGTMLLIPLGVGLGGAINLALAGDARLVGTGRLPGSVMIHGRRSSLSGAMLRAGVLMIAATPPLCGPGAEEGR